MVRGVLRSFIEIAVGKVKRGRPVRAELSEQILALDAEGKTNQEIHETLRRVENTSAWRASNPTSRREDGD